MAALDSKADESFTSFTSLEPQHEDVFKMLLDMVTGMDGCADMLLIKACKKPRSQNLIMLLLKHFTYSAPTMEEAQSVAERHKNLTGARAISRYPDTTSTRPMPITNRFARLGQNREHPARWRRPSTAADSDGV